MEKENEKSHSSLQSLHLPRELVEEKILTRLPVKSLVRFRCVSKPWRSLIGSNRFINKHLQEYTNSRTDDSARVLILCNKHPLNQFKEPFVEPIPIDDPKNNQMKDGRFVDYCNGLFCMYKEPGCFFLWNPATRISAELPKLDLQNLLITKMGFGWDEQSGAYKVFVVISDWLSHDIGRVYSSKTNSWTGIPTGNDPEFRIGIFACGKLHWHTKSGGHSYIEAFDLESETFGKIELPCEGGVEIFLKRHFEGWLVAFHEVGNGIEKVWIMKQYGVKESWVEEIEEPSKIMDNIIKTIEGLCCEPIVYLESLVSPLLQ